MGDAHLNNIWKISSYFTEKALLENYETDLVIDIKNQFCLFKKPAEILRAETSNSLNQAVYIYFKTSNIYIVWFKIKEFEV
jgi:hypothetical protein